MATKLAKEIRSEAWKALGEGQQYWTYVAGYLILALVTAAMVIPLVLLLMAGFIVSGAMPYFQPGGHPEIGLLTDPSVMMPILSAVLVFSIAIIYPVGFVAWGHATMAIATMRRGLKFGHAFAGWGHGWKMGWIMMVKGTYIFLWCLLLYVPGIVKALAYAMTDYIAIDHPDWSATQCITESRRLMNGHKWRYFCLLVSFFGWFLLLMAASAVPMLNGIVQYFFMPYFDSARAAFYEDLLDRDSARGGNPEAAASSGEVTDYVSAVGA